MSDLIEEMEAESDAAVAQAEARAPMTLTELGQAAWSLKNLIGETEELLKARKKELERLMMIEIPEKLNQVGIDGFSFTDEFGEKRRIEKDTMVFGSLKKAPDLDAAVAYLEENGLRGAVKTTLSLDFMETQRETAEELIERLKDPSWPMAAEIPEVHVVRDINASTLRAFVRARMLEGADFDPALVGAEAFPGSKFV